MKLKHKKGEIIMKRIISTLLVCVLLVGCVLTLASCGTRLSGTYSAESEIMGQSIETSYTFKGKNVTVEVKTTVLGVVNSESVEGTYEIDGDEITFTMEKDGETESQTVTFEKGDDYIKLAGVKYTKK